MNDINIENTPTAEVQNQDIFVADGVANNSFVKDSNTKIGILTLLFGIFYPIGYFYKQWKAIKLTNEKYKNISPFWRGLFYPFYAFKFTKILDNLLTIKKEISLKNATSEEEKEKIEAQYSGFKQFYCYAYFIAFLPLAIFMLILLSLFADFSPSTSIGTGISFAMIFTLCNLQKGINKVLPENHPKKSLSFSDFLGIPVGGILFITFIFSIFIFTDPHIKIKGNILTDKSDKYSITFPFENQKVVRRGIEFYCQNKPGSTSKKDFICAETIPVTSPFEKEAIIKELEEQDNVKVISSKTALYNDNLGYCFSVEKDYPYKNICIMKFKDNPKNGIYVTSQKDEDVPFENLEKILNSYQKL